MSYLYHAIASIWDACDHAVSYTPCAACSAKADGARAELASLRQDRDIWTFHVATLRATIEQQQKRIEAGEHLAIVADRVLRRSQHHDPEAMVAACEGCDLEGALEDFRKSALTKAFSELASTVDAIRTQEMEQSAMTKIADESGNEPPIGVQP